MDAEPEDKKSIYTLELHEELQLPESFTWVRRVAGGWTYSEYSEAARSIIVSVFVPFHSEFMREEGIREH